MLLNWFRLLSQRITSQILLLFFCDPRPTVWAFLDFVPCQQSADLLALNRHDVTLSRAMRKAIFSLLNNVNIRGAAVIRMSHAHVHNLSVMDALTFDLSTASLTMLCKYLVIIS